MDRSTPSPQVSVIHEPDRLALFARYGVGDMTGIEGTEDRVIELPVTAPLGYPMHGIRLVPDACRSCRFLAGEVR